jgi:ferredoxin-NADP reductase
MPDHSEYEIFMCGMAGFMKAARATVGEISVTALNEECFGKKIVIEDKNAVGGEIYFALSGKHGAYAPSETLLKAALNAGIWIDSSCSRVSAATAR